MKKWVVIFFIIISILMLGSATKASNIPTKEVIELSRKQHNAYNKITKELIQLQNNTHLIKTIKWLDTKFLNDTILDNFINILTWVTRTKPSINNEGLVNTLKQLKFLTMDLLTKQHIDNALNFLDKLFFVKDYASSIKEPSIIPSIIIKIIRLEDIILKDREHPILYVALSHNIYIRFT